MLKMGGGLISFSLLSATLRLSFAQILFLFLSEGLTWPFVASLVWTRVKGGRGVMRVAFAGY